MLSFIKRYLMKYDRYEVETLSEYGERLVPIVTDAHRYCACTYSDNMVGD